MAIDLVKIINPYEREKMGMDSMSEDQRQAVAAWGLRMFTMGQHVVADIDEVKYEGRLVILDDGTRWEVDSVDASKSDMWSSMDKVVIIDDVMYRLDNFEKVSVQEE